MFETVCGVDTCFCWCGFCTFEYSGSVFIAYVHGTGTTVRTGGNVVALFVSPAVDWHIALFLVLPLQSLRSNQYISLWIWCIGHNA
jgi:hypothetical protein